MESIAEKLQLKYIDKSAWKKYRFDQIAKNVSERVEPSTTDLEIYVGLEHIDSESIHIKRYGKREDVNGTKLRCYPGDVIFGRRRAYQRKAAIVEFDGFCSAHSLVLRANPEVIHPKLLPFFLHSDTFMYRAVDISVGSLSPTINWGDLKKQEFMLPPIKLQEQLVELLWSAEKAIMKTNLFKDRLEGFKAIALSEIIESQLKNGLKVIPLSNLYKKKFKTIDPTTLASQVVQHYSLPAYDELGEPELVNASTIKSNKINIDDATILFSKLNPNLPKVWRVTNAGQEKMLGSTEWLPVRPIEGISLDYLYAFLSSSYFLKQVYKFVQGSSNSHKRIDPKQFYQLKLPVLTKEKQELVIEYHTKLNDSVSKSYDNLKLTIQLQKKIINQIF